MTAGCDVVFLIDWIPMRRPLDITPELTRAYAGQNRWGAVFLKPSKTLCGLAGPWGGRCTLAPKHGPVHIAHRYSLNSGWDTAEIYTAWIDDDDLSVDEGL